MGSSFFACLFACWMPLACILAFSWLRNYLRIEWQSDADGFLPATKNNFRFAKTDWAIIPLQLEGWKCVIFVQAFSATLGPC